jgi:hypothetical protein
LFIDAPKRSVGIYDQAKKLGLICGEGYLRPLGRRLAARDARDRRLAHRLDPRAQQSYFAAALVSLPKAPIIFLIRASR